MLNRINVVLNITFSSIGNMFNGQKQPFVSADMTKTPFMKEIWYSTSGINMSVNHVVFSHQIDVSR